MTSLKGKTLFISGASRGIGLAIALRAARDGANVAIAAKTTEPHPRLKGTIYTAADEVRAAGGKALPVVCDIRDEAQVMEAIEKTVAEFGGIDICVNNASAISLTTSQATDMKRFDLMMGINTRGTFMVSKYCIPHLRKAENPHILMLSPPLDMKTKWFEHSTAYTMAKYGMSMCVLGLSGELRGAGIAVNALWPRTTIATAAVGNLLGGDAMMRASRTPEIMGDAAHAIFTRPAREFTGHFCIDDKLLYASGVRDFERYRVDPSVPLMSDFFVPDDDVPPPGVTVATLALGWRGAEGAVKPRGRWRGDISEQANIACDRGCADGDCRGRTDHHSPARPSNPHRDRRRRGCALRKNLRVTSRSGRVLCRDHGPAGHPPPQIRHALSARSHGQETRRLGRRPVCNPHHLP